MAIGYIYILSNSAMNSLLKIGYTCSSVERRVGELSGATGVPGKFVIEFFQITEDVEEAEARIHAELAPFRYNDNREFFSATLSQAVAVVKKNISEPALQFMKVQEVPKPLKSCGRCGFYFAKSDDEPFCPKCGF